MRAECEPSDDDAMDDEGDGGEGVDGEVEDADGRSPNNDAQSENGPASVTSSACASVKCVYARAKPTPIITQMFLPHRHGIQYWYSQLMTKTAWRDQRPSSFITRNDNGVGTLKYECELRGILPEGGEYVLLEGDLKKNYQLPDRIKE